MGRRILCLALLVSVPVVMSGDMGRALDDRLELRVRPKMAPSPGWFRATAMVERHASNRRLTFAAESEDYYRSSSISLDGAESARTHSVTFQQLPPGKYDITVILERNDGPVIVAADVVSVSR
jgi:hypothetical protein